MLYSMLFYQLQQLCCALQPRSSRFPLELADCLSTGARGVENGGRFVLGRKGDRIGEVDEGRQSNVLAGAEGELI